MISRPTDKRLAGTNQSTGPAQKNEVGFGAIMSSLLKPVAGLSLKEIGTIADRNFALEFPDGIQQVTVAGVALPLEHPMERPHGPLVDIGGWHHGGINE